MTLNPKHSLGDYFLLILSVVTGIGFFFGIGGVGCYILWKTLLNQEVFAGTQKLAQFHGWFVLISAIVLTKLWADMVRVLWRNPGPVD